MELEVHLMRGCVCTIVPPNLFERVARTGSPEQREAALDTLSIDHTIRLVRAQNAALSAQSVRRAVCTVGNRGLVHRVIYDAHHRNDQHATKHLRDEGQDACHDQSANEAYEGLGDTYRFYWDVLARDSIDDASMSLLGEVHFGRKYDNAFWDGERMMFGDGSGTLFTGFTSALEVIGHELTHGVTEKTINLLYSGQSGALNESISDVFGVLVKQYKLGQTADQATWLIGEGILGPEMQGVALRSMKAPGTAFDGDSQPAKMADYVSTTSDNGGVHTNSGIPNRAFYLAATAIGGHAWERAGRIWYGVLTARLVGPDAQFAAFAQATLAAASALYGPTSVEAKAVADAWGEVGVLSASQLPAAAALAR
jgi:Zn-dependent metalloprotease